MGKRALTALLASTLAVAPMNAALAGKVDSDNYEFMTCEQIAQDVETLEDFQNFIGSTWRYTTDQDKYGVDQYMASAKTSCNNRSAGIFEGDCDDVISLGAYFLDTEPRALILYYGKGNEYPKGVVHAVYLHKENGKYGAAGVDINQDYRAARFDDVGKLCLSFSKNYSGNLVACGEVNLADMYSDHETHGDMSNAVSISSPILKARVIRKYSSGKK